MTDTTVGCLGVAVQPCTLPWLAFVPDDLTAAPSVVLDATVVRGVLMPAVMAVLGRWSWWPPGRTGDRWVATDRSVFPLSRAI